MKDTATTKVLICGAGAAGLTLAIELARRGIPFRLVEKRSGPFEGSRGKGIQPRTQELFEDLGLLDRIVAAGGPYPPSRIYWSDGSYADGTENSEEAATPSEPFRSSLMIPQFLTEGVMRDRLRELGRKVEFDRELVGFRQDGETVLATLLGPDGEETIRASYLIGADGGRSFVRHELGIGFEGKTLGVRALVADLKLKGLERTVWHRFNHDSKERQISLCPLQGTDLFQLQASIPLEGEVDLSPRGLRALIGERTGRQDIAIESVSWTSAYHLSARLAEQYSVERVFLVGDAAHVHPPTGGQGLNTSVQDAYNLGWKLAAVANGASDRLLDTYQQERRPVAAAMLNLSVGLLEKAKRGEGKRGREVQQLDLGYRDSWLALVDPLRAAGPLAGDRAPDAPVRGAAGQPTRLFTLFRGTHWTLLGYQVEANRVPSRSGMHVHRVGDGGDLCDDNGHFLDAYVVRPNSWVLVRPDGYLGAILSSNQLEALERYLDEWVGCCGEGAVLRRQG